MTDHAQTVLDDFMCESEVFNGPKCKIQCERCKPRSPAIGTSDDAREALERAKRLDETVALIGKALEAGRALASIFPMDDDALPKAKEVVAQRLAVLNTACYEFKTTFHHDLAALRSPAVGTPITTEQLDKLQFGRSLHERPAIGTPDDAREALEVCRPEIVRQHDRCNSNEEVAYFDSILNKVDKALASIPREQYSCSCGQGSEPCPGPDGIPLCVYSPEPSETIPLARQPQGGDARELACSPSPWPAPNEGGAG